MEKAYKDKIPSPILGELIQSNQKLQILIYRFENLN